jgi:hypothetical protein
MAQASWMNEIGEPGVVGFSMLWYGSNICRCICGDVRLGLCRFFVDRLWWGICIHTYLHTKIGDDIIHNNNNNIV